MNDFENSYSQEKSAREAVLQKVREIVGKNLTGLQVKVYLYGSWAQKKERPTSDIDLAVWTDHPLPAGTLARLREALEEAPIPYQVEVVNLQDADESFRQKVLGEGIEWNVCSSA